MFEKDIHPNTSMLFRSFLSECGSIVDRHVQKSKRPIVELGEDEQQTLVDQINAYLEFELAHADIPHGVKLDVSGTGILLLLDNSGNVLGAEIISDGDVVHGALADIAAYPVPTMECVRDTGSNGIPKYDQILSPIVLLKDATYKTGLMRDGLYQVEHDLSDYQTGIVVAHPLTILVNTP